MPEAAKNQQNLCFLFLAFLVIVGYNGLMSKAHEKAVAKYNAKTYTEVKLRLRKEDAEELRVFLDGRSANGFINAAIREKIDREKGGKPPDVLKN